MSACITSLLGVKSTTKVTKYLCMSYHWNRLDLVHFRTYDKRQQYSWLLVYRAHYTRWSQYLQVLTASAMFCSSITVWGTRTSEVLGDRNYDRKPRSLWDWFQSWFSSEYWVSTCLHALLCFLEKSPVQKSCSSAACDTTGTSLDLVHFRTTNSRSTVASLCIESIIQDRVSIYKS